MVTYNIGAKTDDSFKKQRADFEARLGSGMAHLTGKFEIIAFQEVSEAWARHITTILPPGWIAERAADEQALYMAWGPTVKVLPYRSWVERVTAASAQGYNC